MNLNSKIKYLLFKNNIDGYLIPKNDEYFSEYSNPDRLKSISNFSGSAGIAMILFNKNYLFVDGRYKIQAEKESGNSFEIHEITNIDPKYILKKFKNKIKLGFDPKLFTSSYLKKNIKPFCKMIPIKKNLVDIVDTKKKNLIQIIFIP